MRVEQAVNIEDLHKMAKRRLTQVGDMERGRMWVSTLHNHAVSCANLVMTRTTVNVVPLMTTG